jgi:hypothetical protein
VLGWAFLAGIGEDSVAHDIVDTLRWVDGHHGIELDLYL